MKANKGMILRKSVEYIRYLQQLVSAQASRNRELERALRGYRGEGDPAHGADARGDGDGEGALDFMGMMGEMGEGMLEEGMMEGMHTPTSNESPRPLTGGGGGAGELVLHEHAHHAHHHQNGYAHAHAHHGLGYGGYALPSMPEDSEMGMHLDHRPAPMMGAGTGSGSDEGGEEARGRRGRDEGAGRGGAKGGVKKYEYEEEESSGGSRSMERERGMEA